MKRHIWIVALATALALLFVGCGGDGNNTTTYTVTFDGNAPTGTTVSGVPDAIPNVKSGATISKPMRDPSIPDSNWIFDDWYTTKVTPEQVLAETGTKWDFRNDPVTAPTTLYAGWIDEGEAFFTPPDEADIDEDSVIELPEFNVVGGTAATQSGWASRGYNDVMDNNTPTIEEFNLAQYLVLKTNKKPTGTVQLVWQGIGTSSDGTEWNQNDITSTSGVALPRKGLVIEGNDEDGYVLWFKLDQALNSNAKQYSDWVNAKGGVKILLCYYSTNLAALEIESAYLIIDKDALDALDTVDVTFDADGGSTVADIEVSKGYSMAHKYPTDPTKANAEFDGWYLDTDTAFAGTVYTSTTLITGDVDLIAKWAEVYEVTFDLDPEGLGMSFTSPASGTIDSVQVKEGTAMGDKFPDDPVAEGTLQTVGTDSYDESYVFGGWYLDTDTDYEDDPYTDETLITEDTDLIAKWTAGQTVTIKFEDGDGEVILERTLERSVGTLGSAFPANPNKKGSKFEGWSSDGSVADVMQPTAGDTFSTHTTFTAIWSLYSEFTEELGEFDETDGEGNTHKGTWEVDFAKFFQADYLVLLKPTGVGNQYGWGGLDVILQGDGDDWGWNQTPIIGGWFGGSTGGENFLVIKLAELEGYNDIIKGTEAKIIIQANPENYGTFGEDTAWLTNIDLSRFNLASVPKLPMSEDNDGTIGFITQLDVWNYPAGDIPEFTITLADNSPNGYQGLWTIPSFATEPQEDDEFVLKISFTSDMDIDELTVQFIDNGELPADWPWNPISDQETVASSITADTKVAEQTITITLTGTSNNIDGQKLVFECDSSNTGPGTLSIWSFSFEKQ